MIFFFFGLPTRTTWILYLQIPSNLPYSHRNLDMNQLSQIETTVDHRECQEKTRIRSSSENQISSIAFCSSRYSHANSKFVFQVQQLILGVTNTTAQGNSGQNRISKSEVSYFLIYVQAVAEGITIEDASGIEFR